MENRQTNYYGSLCTEMYEILHREAPQDELAFYLSYAQKDMRILEPLCGSGRFLVPFLREGFCICGMDMSAEMLARLKQKAPDADAVQADILQYTAAQKFDYIFISSGSVSLFTDEALCRAVLHKIKTLLKKGGKFVFAVDTVADRSEDREEYGVSVSVKTEAGFRLLLKEKKQYDEATRTQFSPGIYELYDGEKLLRQEKMDFQTHLYAPGEMEPLLQEAGFTEVKAYGAYDKTPVRGDITEMFLYECWF